MTATPQVAAWCEPEDLGQFAPCRAGQIEPEVLVAAIAIASDVLYHLSGRQFPGVRTNTVRPTRDDWSGGRLIGSVSVDVGGDSYSQQGLGRRNDFTSDRNIGVGLVSEVPLPDYPVVAISEVKVDGTVLATSAYQVLDDRWLVRIDGHYWPIFQDLTKPTTEIDTFEVTYTSGVAAPPAGVMACAALACELARSVNPNAADVQLSKRVTSVTRNGMSATLLNPADFLKEGRTGIYLVDLFLFATNPEGLRQRAAVFSPDIDWPVHRIR